MINHLLILFITVLEISEVRISFYQKKVEYQYKQSIGSQERRNDYLYKISENVSLKPEADPARLWDCLEKAESDTVVGCLRKTHISPGCFQGRATAGAGRARRKPGCENGE